ncbi:MAG: glycoside hydrolase family 20 zincin-like fold domain-containing protein [Candidatus Methylomirabilales bacterium]
MWYDSAMQRSVSLLFPRPRQVDPTRARFVVPDEPVIDLAAPPSNVETTVERLEGGLRACRLRPRRSSTGTVGSADIRLGVDPAHRRQSYRLAIDDTGISLVGGDEAGLFYGVCTLLQLIRVHAPATPRDPLALPGVHITDWPDFPHRGVLLDISRDKVPTMETLYDLVDLLASWKINQAQLYMEHTFAYRGHEVVWQHASPLTGEEIEALDTFCCTRYVELVPNQNSFGHMHRWLIHEPYRPLAECPEGIVHPFSPNREPYGLCPADPESLVLLADLYGQLLPHFTSRQFNVGLDETFDLGHGRSASLCRAKGRERVYLDFLKQIHSLATQRGRTMQFWSDMIVQTPELIGELPKDVIALEWGYEAEHPFAERSRLFTDAGLHVYVCPGTSSWNSIAGRTANCLANLSNAAGSGQATRAAGLLTTDWGDNGHLQPLPVSYLGLLAGAGWSWNSTDDADRSRLSALLDAHAFQDQAGVMGRLAYDLGNTYLHTRVHTPNGSVLFWLLLRPDQPPPDGLSVERLEETLAYIDQVTAPLPKARMARPDAADIVAEFCWAADMLRLACRVGLARLQADPGSSVNALPATIRTALAAELRARIQQHRALWPRRNRPGGLADSVARLERTLALLEA